MGIWNKLISLFRQTSFKKEPTSSKKPHMLNVVFGISTAIPSLTYVDRSKLDDRFKYLLTTDRHIVIHGASKQGKTVLRKKVIPENEVVIVQCSANTKLIDVYSDILRSLHVEIPVQFRQSQTTSQEYSAHVNGEVASPVHKVGAGADLTKSVESDQETVSEPVGTNTSNLGYTAENIKKSGKRIVIEDFHYLAEDDQRNLY